MRPWRGAACLVILLFVFIHGSARANEAQSEIPKDHIAALLQRAAVHNQEFKETP